MLRLPWEAWGETDVMLGMAADLHDRLVCTCGCGQWEADAHDPDKADLWAVDHDVCYVRRAIDKYVKAHEPPNEAVLSVRLHASEESQKADAKARVEELRAMMRAASPPNEPDDHPSAPADESGDQRDQ